MNETTDRCSFSLTELLVVIAVVLILLSLVLVAANETTVAATRLECQQRLEQLDKACRMFSNQHGGRELAYLDFSSGPQSARWFDKLLPYLGVGAVEQAADYLNCPNASPEDAAYATAPGPGLGMPVLIYRTSNRSHYGTYEGIRDDLRASDEFQGGCDLVHYDTANDTQYFEPGGLDRYGQLWVFSFSSGEVDAFDPRNPAQRDIETVRLFREQHGGGLFMVGDHSGWTASNPEDHYGNWNTSLNEIADHCKLGICLRSARSHNEQVQSSGHFIGNGLTWLPRGTVPKSVGHVARDDREDDERTSRHGCVSFPICCRGHQPEGGSGVVTPAGVHEQPCGVIGVMDDGLGRVCVGSTFTRWGTSYYSSSSNHGTLRTLAEQIAVWLAGGRGEAAGGITYGYNNQVGRTEGPDQAGPSVPRLRTTIRILDYKYYVADFDGKEADNDDPSCIATRHGGRANVLFCDGRVEALTVEQIMSPANNYWDVHK